MTGARGFVFPHELAEGHPRLADGLTKREHFAGLALPVAFGFLDGGYCNVKRTDESNSRLVAEIAVRLADELLAELDATLTAEGAAT